MDHQRTKEKFPNIKNVPIEILMEEKMTKVVHCKREPYDIYIGRPSKWGNPFKVGEDGTYEEVVQKYKEWVIQQPDLMAALGELKGKVLGCWCKPYHPCHGDVLAELADSQE